MSSTESLLFVFIGDGHEELTSLACTSTVEYVVCKTCKSPDTLLNKENRLYFVTCESCGSRECLFSSFPSEFRSHHCHHRSIRRSDQDRFPGSNRKKGQACYVVYITSHSVYLYDDRFHALQNGWLWVFISCDSLSVVV